MPHALGEKVGKSLEQTGKEAKTIAFIVRALGVSSAISLILQVYTEQSKFQTLLKHDYKGFCKHAVTAFPTQYTDNDRKNSKEHKYVYPLVEHGKKVHTYFNISAAGCTPLAESLWWVLPRLLAQKEDRKIILLITDGEPDNKISARKALEYAKKFGVEVYGVALEACSIDELLPQTSVTLQGVHELPQAMFGILQSALVNNK